MPCARACRSAAQPLLGVCARLHWERRRRRVVGGHVHVSDVHARHRRRRVVGRERWEHQLRRRALVQRAQSNRLRDAGVFGTQAEPLHPSNGIKYEMVDEEFLDLFKRSFFNNSKLFQ